MICDELQSLLKLSLVKVTVETITCHHHVLSCPLQQRDFHIIYIIWISIQKACNSIGRFFSSLYLIPACCIIKIKQLDYFSLRGKCTWYLSTSLVHMYNNKVVWDWVSDFCLTPIQQVFNYNVYHGKNKLIINEWGPLCSIPTRWVGFYSACSLKQQSRASFSKKYGRNKYSKLKLFGSVWKKRLDCLKKNSNSVTSVAFWE